MHPQQPSPSRRPIRFLALVAALAGLAAAGSASAQNPACGSAVTGIVTLQADLVCPPGVSALRVAASDVTIRLNGFTILGSPGAHVDPMGIESARHSRLSVEGPGRIEGFHVPISIEGGSGHYIAGLETAGNRQGPVLVDVVDSVLKGNRIESLVIQSVNGASTGNDVSANAIGGGTMGITLAGCGTVNNLLASNHIESSGMPALRMIHGAQANRVESNAMLGMMVLEGSSANRMAANTIEAPMPNATAVWMVAGVDCLGNTVGSSANEFTGNRVAGGATSLIVDGDASAKVASQGNVIFANNFLQASHAGIVFGPLAVSNDARRNKYLAVGTPVIDLGSGNLWP